MNHVTITLNERDLLRLNLASASDNKHLWIQSAVEEYMETVDTTFIPGQKKRITYYISDMEFYGRLTNLCRDAYIPKAELVADAIRWKLGQQTAADRQATPQ